MTISYKINVKNLVSPFSIVVCFNLFYQSVLIAQTIDNQEQIYVNPRIDSTISFLEPLAPFTKRIHFHIPSSNKVYDRSYTDSTCPFNESSFNLSHLASNLNIQYLNDSVWFIYGTRTEYAYYPYVFRTTDTGLSWQTIIRSNPNVHNRKIDYISMRKNLFHMFDLINGIWIVKLENNHVNYRITSDGGFTWKNRSFFFKRAKEIEINSSVFDVSYKEANSIQISIKGYFKKDGKWTNSSFNPIYYSNNFGRKFKRLKQ